MPRHVRLSSEVSAAAVAHLRASDPVMGQIIASVGPFGLKPMRNRFHALVRSIISQQISSKAAASIRQKLETIVEPYGGMTPESLLHLSTAQMRKAGLSPQKQAYLRELARRVHKREVRLERLHHLSDEDVIAELIQVKGIGRWTAQMFLIFTLGRADVFPHDDLGVRAAIKRFYGLDELPDKETSHRIAAAWRPYATVASWYCWRSLSLPSEPL
ncbi:MAG TPA: DNA-3-methyladenine glycosylase [Planctomycetaceae bacterium]|nr:DNA-3-methyladenine glycosylase [Planctomycetaceae bacterium]